MSNWYKPRYKFCYIVKNKIWPYKKSRLRKMIDKRGRSIYRKGWWPHRRFMVMKNLKWILFRKNLGSSFSLFSFKNSMQKRIYNPSNKYKFQMIRFKGFRMSYGKIDREKFQHLFKRFFKKKFVFKYLNFLKSLEFRLDMILFRLKIFPTIFGCHNLIKSLGVYVNGNLLKTPGFLVQVGDVISFSYHIWFVLMLLFTEKIQDRLHREILSQQRYKFKYLIFKKFKKRIYQKHFNLKKNFNQKFLNILNKGYYSKKSLYLLKRIDRNFFFKNFFFFRRKKRNRIKTGYYLFHKFFKTNLRNYSFNLKEKIIFDFIFLMKKKKNKKLLHFLKTNNKKNLLKFYNKNFYTISYFYVSQKFMNWKLQKTNSVLKNMNIKNSIEYLFNPMFKKYYFKMLYFFKIYFNLKKLILKFIINKNIFLNKNDQVFKNLTTIECKILLFFNFIENRIKPLFDLLRKLRILIKLNSNIYVFLNNLQKIKNFTFKYKKINIIKKIKQSIKEIIFNLKIKIFNFFMSFNLNKNILNQISLLIKNFYFFISFLKTKKLINNIFYYKIYNYLQNEKNLKYRKKFFINNNNLNNDIKKTLLIFLNDNFKELFLNKNKTKLIEKLAKNIEKSILSYINNNKFSFDSKKIQDFIYEKIFSFFYLQIKKEIWSIYFINIYKLNNIFKLKTLDSNFYFNLLKYFNSQNINKNSNSLIKSFVFSSLKKQLKNKKHENKSFNKNTSIKLFPTFKKFEKNLTKNKYLKLKIHYNSSYWASSSLTDYKKYLILYNNMNRNILQKKKKDFSWINLNRTQKWRKIYYNKIKKILKFLKKNRRKNLFKQKRFLNLKYTHNWYIPSYIEFDFNTLRGIIISEPSENSLVFSLCEPFYLRSLISFYKRIGF